MRSGGETDGATAWVSDLPKEEAFRGAATHYISLVPEGSRQDVHVLEVGHVVISASFEAGWYPTAPDGIGLGGWLGVTNIGPVVVAVTLPSWAPDVSSRIVFWLQPTGQPGDSDPVFHAGEVINEGGNVANVWPFAVLEYGGTSATGTVAFSARVNTADQTVEVVVSAQANG